MDSRLNPIAFPRRLTNTAITECRWITIGMVGSGFFSRWRSVLATEGVVGSYIMTGDGDELAADGVRSSSRTTGDEKPGCLGVGEMSHMLGNVSTSARVRSTELPDVLSGGGRGGAAPFA